MKIAPILRELERSAAEAVLVHTGQHYDEQMSDAFFRDLGIRKPDFHLGVGSASQAVQTARLMESFEPVLLEVRPDWLVVVGDVNSTLATALVAVKLKEATGTRIAHVEAGLRSKDWRMPEEVNRVLTDRLSDLLLTPSEDARVNLREEGIPDDRIVFVGNVMIDTLMAALPAAKALGMAGRLGVDGRDYAVVTLHRPSNVDRRASLAPIAHALRTLAERMPVLLPLHPRTKKSIESTGLWPALQGVQVIEPLGYIEMLSLTQGAAIVLTDSGGIQEETTVLGVPCVTLRETTERPITVTEGTNRVVPWPITEAGLLASVQAGLASRNGSERSAPAGWDGRSAERIVAALQ
jgi:UDP-N-acetylglucosamine 2-epimerase (non-hydrolysing)